MQLLWDTDRENLLLQFDKAWTWDEFHTAIKQAHENILIENNTVNLIIWHQVAMPNGNVMSHLVEAFQTQPSNVGRVYVIVTSAGTGTMMSFFLRLVRVFERAFPGKNKVMILTSYDELKQHLGKLPQYQQG